MITIDALQGPITLRIRDDAPFGFLAIAVLFDHVAQRIRPAHAVDHRREEIRPFGHGAPHGNAARVERPPMARMLRRGGGFRAQLLAHGDQVAPGVRLVLELSSLVPFAAVLAAAVRTLA